MIIEISVAVASLAFVILVAAVVLSLRKVNQTLDSVDRTLKEVRPQLEEVADESRKTLIETRKLIDDMNRKSQQTDVFFESVQGLGHSFQELSTGIARTASAQKERLANVTALVGSGLELLRRWRSERRSDKQDKIKRVN
ncbi:DUF948 domain-containing protein [Kroppenstedtia eburnea]|uniref:DUF948 domain-containing protein n=1 Tax=Kroppenstedtia eburnea TaxID=714067 RepID=A0A1N7NC97_9BACL|nr:DUF948 domain-containing protein [Kroppenstedtia eburnea]QKI83083.1 DUF948 domain-containing protein [Kroppenstedtia eburnea]SIS95898.1 protein of unknown function [Kroppenstedtia eburnea]